MGAGVGALSAAASPHQVGVRDQATVPFELRLTAPVVGRCPVGLQVITDSGGFPSGVTNRPLMPDHVKTINKYVQGPPGPLHPARGRTQRAEAARHPRPRGNFRNRLGFMVIGGNTKFYVTDGQDPFLQYECSFDLPLKCADRQLRDIRRVISSRSRVLI